MATLLRTLDELELVGVYDRGVPNQERVVLRARRQVNLGEYIMSLAITVPGGNVVPIPNTMLWLGEEQVAAKHWIFVYTGPGQRLMTQTVGGEPAVVIHWGQAGTVPQDERIVPVILQLSGILTPQSRETLGDLLALTSRYSDLSQADRAALSARAVAMPSNTLTGENKPSLADLANFIARGGKRD